MLSNKRNKYTKKRANELEKLVPTDCFIYNSRKQKIQRNSTPIHSVTIHEIHKYKSTWMWNWHFICFTQTLVEISYKKTRTIYRQYQKSQVRICNSNEARELPRPPLLAGFSGFVLLHGQIMVGWFPQRTVQPDSSRRSSVEDRDQTSQWLVSVNRTKAMWQRQVTCRGRVQVQGLNTIRYPKLPTLKLKKPKCVRHLYSATFINPLRKR